MLHSVFERTLHDQRRSLIGWTAGIALTAVVMLAVFPTVRDNPEFNKLVENYPEALKAMFGIGDYQTGVGYLHSELYSMMVPLLLTIYAVLAGSDATSGEEERRTIDLLLANPVSRRRVVLEKFAALVVGLVLIGAALWVALAAGGPLVRLNVGLWDLAVATAASVALAASFGALAMAIGAATGRRGLSRGLVAALAVLAYLVSGLAELVDWLEPWRPLSPWWHAVGVEPLRNGLGAVDVGVLGAAIVVLPAVAAWAFTRRDLAA